MYFHLVLLIQNYCLTGAKRSQEVTGCGVVPRMGGYPQLQYPKISGFSHKVKPFVVLVLEVSVYKDSGISSVCALNLD
jgi:hypothetical protein